MEKPHPSEEAIVAMQKENPGISRDDALEILKNLQPGDCEICGKPDGH